MDEEYREVRNDEHHTLSDDGQQYSVTFKATQQDYFKYWDEHAKEEMQEGSIYVHYRWATWSPIDPDNVEYDYFTLEVQSSGESRSALCDWSEITLDSSAGLFTQALVYIVDDDSKTKKEVRIPITSFPPAGLEDMDEVC